MSNSSDNDDFTKNLYQKRGRSDSLGKESTGGELYGDHDDAPMPNEEDLAYVPKRRDTFHLRRGTVDSANDDGFGGRYGDLGDDN